MLYRLDVVMKREKGRHRASTRDRGASHMPRGQGEHEASPLQWYGFASRGVHGGKAPSQGDHQGRPYNGTASPAES